MGGEATRRAAAVRTAAGWTLKRLEEQALERGDCGDRRRLFSRDDPSPAAFIHAVRIRDAKPHYHRRATEYYYVLEGEGVMVLDGEEVPLAPGCCLEVRPGTVHRARGSAPDGLLVLVIGVPSIADDDIFYP